MSPTTRTIALVRHAKSCWRYPGLDDHQRPLSRRGLRDCARLPDRLAPRLQRPGRVLCSDAVRTVQTCEALACALGLADGAVALVPELYLASAARILEIVASIDADERHLMVIGHNPGMTDLFVHLSGQPLENLPTFGVAELAFDVPGWESLAPGGGRVLHLITPKTI